MKKKWHIKRDCRDWKKKKDSENEGSSRSVHVVEENLDDADGVLLSVTSNSKHPVDSWIFDSACSFHMTSNRYWFDTYILVHFGIVTIGNGVHCKITSICNIMIKMFDCVVKTFCDIRHVLEVEKNLTSLGTLDSNGLGYKSKGGVKKVIKGAMVVMRGRKVQKISINFWKVQL